MTKPEELTPSPVVRRVAGEPVTVVATHWAGLASVVLTRTGRVDEQLVYRTYEAELILNGQGRVAAKERRVGEAFSFHDARLH
jgi:hypothetical protein